MTMRLVQSESETPPARCDCVARTNTALRETKADFEKVEVFLDEGVLCEPLSWQKPQPVFVCSMSDLFADFVNEEDVRRIFAVMMVARRHTFQILTKRPERMAEFFKRN